MHIEFLRDIKDPDTGVLLYHKGQRVHRMTAVCAPYLDRKAAVEVKPARRGTKEWFTERREQSALAGSPDSQDVNPCVKGVEWGVKGVSDSGFRVPTVIKKFGSETVYFSSPPADAPASIKQRFADLTNSTGSTAAADFEAARNRQIEYEHSLENVKRY